MLSSKLNRGSFIKRQLTTNIEREGDGYFSLYPEVDVASQADTIEKAKQNLCEALELFFETASPEKIKERTLFVNFNSGVKNACENFDDYHNTIFYFFNGLGRDLPMGG